MIPQKLNSLIPMEDAGGNRCFVNQWDVAPRVQDGWHVVGKLEQHTATVAAPVDALTTRPKPKAADKAPPAPPQPAAPPAK